MEHVGESKNPLQGKDPASELYGRTKHGGIIFRIMDEGGPTDDREGYVEDAAAEINRSKSLCFKANMTDPTDPSYRQYLEQLFLRKLDDVTILTPFYCDMGIRVRLGSQVFINDNVNLIAGGGIEIHDGVLIAPRVCIATVNHDVNDRHRFFTYHKVVIRKNAWICTNATICPGVTIGENSIVAAGAVVTRDVPENVIVGGNPAVIIRRLEKAGKSMQDRLSGDGMRLK